MKIESIELDLIKPHPKNPRQDLGDLTELVASIREYGVLQNITVVPEYDGEEWTGFFTCVIGHRRCAASREAGLTEVPCVITEMSEREQIAAMVVENDQRNALTPYEQSIGYQMMLDVGMSVGDICKAVGASERKVRRRLKLAEFDGETLREASGKAITFDELEKIGVIKDEAKRNEVLASYGTRDYNYNLDRAIRAQDEEEDRECFRRALTARGAIEIDSPFGGGYVPVSQAMCDDDTTDELTDKMIDGVQYYFAFNGRWCYLRAEQTVHEPSEEEREAEEKAEREREREKERREKLKEATASAYRLRTMFVAAKVTETKCKDHVNDIISFMQSRIWCDPSVSGGRYHVAQMDKYIGGITKDSEKTAAEIRDRLSYTWPHKSLLWSAMALTWDHAGKGYVDYNGEHMDNAFLDEIYALLRKLGYVESTEEEQLREGTHPLFWGDEEDDEFWEGDGYEE